MLLYHRYGESWENVEAPASLTAPSDVTDASSSPTDLDQRSQRAFKHLLFDLTGEILCDIYADEDVSDAPAWVKPPKTRNKYYKTKNPPTTADALKPLASEHVLKHLQLLDPAANGGGGVDARAKLNIGRKKKDRVDEILIQELKADEPAWTNYDSDELAVKMQLSDAIFDTLLVETGRVLLDVTSRRQARRQQQQQDDGDS